MFVSTLYFNYTMLVKPAKIGAYKLFSVRVTQEDGQNKLRTLLSARCHN
jgi:hypothetical protein